VLADDVVFTAPGGARGEGKAACVEFYSSWFEAFPDAHVEVRDAHILDDVAVDYIQVLRFRDGRHVSFNLMFDRLLGSGSSASSPRQRHGRSDARDEAIEGFGGL
jgi:hypothetical protein